MEKRTIDEQVRDYFAIQDMLAELQAQAEAIKDNLKAAMVEEGVEELEGTGWRATWHNTTTGRFDSTAFKKEHADLYKAFTKQVSGTRFTLNQVKPAA